MKAEMAARPGIIKSFHGDRLHGRPMGSDIVPHGCAVGV